MEIEVEIEHFNAKGRGVGWLQRAVPAKVEVGAAVPGDAVRVELGRKRRGTHLSFLREIVRPSPLRVSPRCAHAHECGGCAWQQLDYSAQLKFKQALVAEAFAPFAVSVPPIVPCATPWEYRNKMEFSFSQNKAGERFLGLVLSGSKGRVLNIQECHLSAPWFSAALRSVRTWWEQSGLTAYRMPTGEGALRTLIVREGQRTGDKLVMLTVSGDPRFALSKAQIAAFKAIFPENMSLFLRIQQQLKGVPTQFYEIHLGGPAHIRERLDIAQRSLTFQISPSSFFQPNTRQAEVLYTLALQMLDLPPQAHAMDLYCGTAAIGMALALKAARVVGIELNPYAVFDAQANIALNGIGNLEIMRGDVGQALAQLQASPTFVPPEAVVVDPPRSGLDQCATQHLLRLKAQKILYISCNPKTQAANVQALCQGGYQLVQLQPVDQFPHTVHIENIALLRHSRFFA